MCFSADTLDFLMENRFHDSRAWFHEHKKEYQTHVIRPLAHLVEQLADTVLQIDPLMIAEPKVGRSISHINRDIRYTKDKSFYREVMWCVFRRDKKIYPSSPALFFEFGPGGFRYGCGYYDVPTKTMAAMRALILKGDLTFMDALEAYRNQDVFAIEGEPYKRPHYPDEPQWKRDWLERRYIDFIHNSKDFELLFSPRLPQVLAQGFLTLTPIYRFMWKAETLARME